MTATTRELGRSGLHAAPLAFGGNVFGWSVDERTTFALLDAFVDAGFNLIDTADVYSAWAPGNTGGESETLIGRWLKASGKRQQVLIATKVAKWGEQPGLSAENITSAVEGSLRRLQTDVIDLYQAHEEDPSEPLEASLGAFSRLIEQGKVRAIGASNFRPATLRQALKISADYHLPRFETLQPLYNLCDRSSYEAELATLASEHRLGVLPYYALASGFLTGKYRSAADAALSSARGVGVVARYLNRRGLRILQALDDVAASHNATPAQVALAWLMAQPGISAPIASATSREQLGELLAAARLQLDAQALSQLASASAEDQAVAADSH